MAIAALIIVGLLLVTSTIIASLLVQNRIEQRAHRAVLGRDESAGHEEDEYSRRLRTALRSRLSHELRTPLNSIITLSQLLIEDESSSLTVEQRRYVEVIRRN